MRRPTIDVWTFCHECKNRYCCTRPRQHVPYRDRASQFNLRADPRPNLVEDNREGEETIAAEPRPADWQDDAREGREAPNSRVVREDPQQSEDEGATEASVLPELEPEATPAYPTLAEYEARWADKVAMHGKR